MYNIISQKKKISIDICIYTLEDKGNKAGMIQSEQGMQCSLRSENRGEILRFAPQNSSLGVREEC